MTLQEFKIEVIDVVDGSHVTGMDIEYIRMTLPTSESDLIFRQLLDGLANESLTYLHKVEALPIQKEYFPHKASLRCMPTRLLMVEHEQFAFQVNISLERES